MPFVSGEIYHVYNRSIARLPIFNRKNDYIRILDLLMYYRYLELPLRFSHFNRLSEERKRQYEEIYFTNKKKSIDILAYAIMPNHLHFLLKPYTFSAISNFMRNIQNGYAKYYNIKNDRTGSLFQFMFKAKRIETEEQLIHVSRYIHLNPVTAFIINIDQLGDYMWNSFKDYLEESSSLVTTQQILNLFSSKEQYKNFVYDQVDYQRELDKIKHLLYE